MATHRLMKVTSSPKGGLVDIEPLAFSIGFSRQDREDAKRPRQMRAAGLSSRRIAPSAMFWSQITSSSQSCSNGAIV
jgi:hypothetical protein